jgi:hypothetical protein
MGQHNTPAHSPGTLSYSSRQRARHGGWKKLFEFAASVAAFAGNSIEGGDWRVVCGFDLARCSEQIT